MILKLLLKFTLSSRVTCSEVMSPVVTHFPPITVPCLGVIVPPPEKNHSDQYHWLASSFKMINDYLDHKSSNTLSTRQATDQSLNNLNDKASNKSISQSINQSIKYSVNQSTNYLMIESINQSINRSIKQ